MTAIYSLLTSVWFAPLAGVISILMLIWLAAPLLAQFGFTWLTNPTNQIIVSAVVILVYLAFILFRYFRNRARSRKLSQDLAGKEVSAEEKAADAEAEKLQEIFRNALDDLKTHAAGGKKKDYLYRLPWYIIIGPPGCGKTTALINSGLQFPLAEKYGQHKIRGVGGTRYCDWWFSEDAILLDTAGRYSTQDSNALTDKSAWDNFLGLIKKNRPRRPINGVILAVSLSELMQSDAGTRTETAVRLRQRLQELRKTLGIQFPVYLMFTKLDLVSGAMEFFGQSDKEDRKQVFGFTYPYETVVASPGHVVEAFDPEFELLIDSLDRRLIDRLQDERDGERRDQVYAFTKQFASLQPMLKEFVSDVFSPSRYELALNLRGAYFSSGTQEGRPIDRIRARIFQLFSLSGGAARAFEGKGKSYFLERLFREVMFPEAGLAGTDIKVERRNLWIKRATFAAIGVFTGLWMFGWLVNYGFHQDYVKRVNQQLAELTRSADKLGGDNTDLRAALELLDQARSIPGAEMPPSVAVWRGMGLFQGAKLGKGARTAYAKALEQVFLPRLLILLEQRLADGIAQPPRDRDLQEIYVTLQTYLLFDRHRYSEHFDRGLITSWFAREWAEDARYLPGQRESLRGHLDNLLDILSDSLPFPPDDALIAAVRGALPSTLDAGQVLLQIKTPAGAVPSFNLNDIAKRKMALVVGRISGAPLTEGIEGTYTAAGYPLMLEAIDSRVRELGEGDWVLNLPPLGPDEMEELTRELAGAYQREYCAQWSTMLGDIKLLEPHTLRDALDKLNVLADKESPLKKLLEAVLVETKPVEACFEPLQVFAAGEAPTEMDGMFERLEGLTVLLIPLADLENQADRLDSAILRSIQSEIGALSSNKPFPLDGWLGDFLHSIPSLLDQGITGQLNRAWKADVLSFCQRAIHGRYPISGGSKRDVNLADFKKFFAKGGLLDEFLESGEMNLAQYVDMSRSPWTWRALDSRGRISSQTLRALENGRRITQHYFPQGGTPEARFRVQLLRTEPELSGVVFDYHGATALMHKGSAAVILEWPPKSTKPLQLELYRRADDPAPLKLVERGDWALIRLFDRGLLRKRQSDLFELSVSAGGATAVFEVRADSVFNPLNANPEGFFCPRNL